MNQLTFDFSGTDFKYIYLQGRLKELENRLQEKNKTITHLKHSRDGYKGNYIKVRK